MSILVRTVVFRTSGVRHYFETKHERKDEPDKAETPKEQCQNMLSNVIHLTPFASKIQLERAAIKFCSAWMNMRNLYRRRRHSLNNAKVAFDALLNKHTIRIKDFPFPYNNCCIPEMAQNEHIWHLWCICPVAVDESDCKHQ